MCKARLLYRIYTCTERRLKREASQLHFVQKTRACTGITQMFVQVASVRKEFHHGKNLRHSWKVRWTEYSIRYNYSSIITEVWKDVAQLQIHVRNLTDWQTCGQMHAMYYHIVEEAHIWKGDRGEHVCSGGVHMWKGIAQCTCTVYRVQTRACGKPAHSRRVTLVYSTNDARMNILRTMGWVVYSEVARMWKVVAHLWTSLWKKSLAFKSHAKLQYNKLLKHWLQFHCCPSAENCCRPTNLRLSPALC